MSGWKCGFTVALFNRNKEIAKLDHVINVGSPEASSGTVIKNQREEWKAKRTTHHPHTERRSNTDKWVCPHETEPPLSCTQGSIEGKAGVWAQMSLQATHRSLSQRCKMGGRT